LENSDQQHEIEFNRPGFVHTPEARNLLNNGTTRVSNERRKL
jgi:hypothetical protein